MNNKTPSDSIDRLLGPVGWIGWMVALTLAAILTLRIWIETTMLFVTIPAVVVALIILLMIYRRKEKQIGEITPPWKNIQVPHEAFEKLLAQVTDLRIAFRAVTYIVSVLIFALSFLGYTEIKDITKETVVADINSKLTGFEKRLDDSQKQLNTLEPQLTGFESRIKKGLGVFRDSLSAILKQQFPDAVVPIPNYEKAHQISIPAKSEVLGYIVIGDKEGSDDLKFGNKKGGSKHRFRLIFDGSNLVISTANLEYIEHKFITRR